MNMSSVKEYKVCNVKDLQNENQEYMKEVQLGEDGSCLIIRLVFYVIKATLPFEMCKTFLILHYRQRGR